MVFLIYDAIEIVEIDFSMLKRLKVIDYYLLYSHNYLTLFPFYGGLVLNRKYNLFRADSQYP